MTDLAIALVDYDNVRLRVDRNQQDTDFNAAMLIRDIIWKTRQTVARPREYMVRFYGGWIDELGQLTALAQWLVLTSSNQRGRHHGAMVKPHVVTSLAMRVGDVLVGSSRRASPRVHQKMVDCMIAVDLLHYARSEPVVVLVSDDDDFVPVVLAASVSRAAHVIWLRHRREGWGLNDRILTAVGVRFGALGEGT